MEKIISVLNEKGGCGKSVTVINLAEFFAMKGKKVLIVDNDPQGNVSNFYSLNYDNTGFESYQEVIKQADLAISSGKSNGIDALCEWLDIMEDEADTAAILQTPSIIKYAIKPTKNPLIHIIPGTLRLEAVESALQSELRPGSTDAYERLERAFKRVKNEFDYIIIDCPPRISMLIYNAVYASDEVIIPLEPNKESLCGLRNVLHNAIHMINQVRDNPVNYRILLNKVKDRKYDSQYMEVVRHTFPQNVFQSVIGMSQAKAVYEAGFKHSAVILDEKLKIAKDFRNLGNELLQIESEGK